MKMLATRLRLYGKWFPFLDTILTIEILDLHYPEVTINFGLSDDIRIILSLELEMTTVRSYMHAYIYNVYKSRFNPGLIKQKIRKQGIEI